MFQFPAFPAITGHPEGCEVTLGNHRIKGFLHLPDAYRSLTRPSSVLEPSDPPIGVAIFRRYYTIGLTHVQVAYDWYHGIARTSSIFPGNLYHFPEKFSSRVH
jgi:hypothetical protein